MISLCEKTIFHWRSLLFFCFFVHSTFRDRYVRECVCVCEHRVMRGRCHHACNAIACMLGVSVCACCRCEHWEFRLSGALRKNFRFGFFGWKMRWLHVEQTAIMVTATNARQERETANGREKKYGSPLPVSDRTRSIFPFRWLSSEWARLRREPTSVDISRIRCWAALPCWWYAANEEPRECRGNDRSDCRDCVGLRIALCPRDTAFS